LPLRLRFGLALLVFGFLAGHLGFEARLLRLELGLGLGLARAASSSSLFSCSFALADDSSSGTPRSFAILRLASAA